MISRLFCHWNDLSVSKKLYSVVGLMVFLITFELFTLKYTVNVLSAVRAFVAGEGQWSKAQKNALLEIQNYIIFRDEKHYQAFLEHLDIPMGDRSARLELSQSDPEYEKIEQGFLKGRNHQSDIKGMTNLILRFSSISYLARAIEAWVQADVEIDQLLKLGEAIHSEVLQTPKNQPLARKDELLARISELNTKISILADRFSFTLGEASRWVEYTLLLFVLILILIIESTGLFFTIRFSKGLIRSLNELNFAAKKIGTGDFTQRAPVHSKDELGELAVALNRMSQNLQEMEIKKEHAEETNQTKSIFLASMSHEIRTPLGAILGFIELLKEPNLSDLERIQYLEIVSKTGEALVTIINDILDLSKVEAGKVEITKEVFSLQSLLRDIEMLMTVRSADKGLLLRFEFADGAPDLVYTDAQRVRQILINLIGNAIKFTSRGSVVVRTEANDDDLIFSIRDTGPGILQTDVARLFTPFVQGDASGKRAHSGTGLGLVLAKDLAKLLGGDVVLKSTQPGMGSFFRASVTHAIPDSLKSEVRFPGDPLFQRKQIPGGHPDITAKKILLVEDSVENQILFSHILRKNGAEVKIAGNGQIGVDLALQEEFDLILMDMQMPVMDGFLATALLRKNGYEKPIISLTAHAMKDDLKKCLEAGCSEILTKPISKRQLLEAISRHVESGLFGP